MISRIINFVLYQIGWFACVLGASQDWSHTGALLAAALVGIHLLLVQSFRVNATIVLTGAVVGVFVETILMFCNVYEFSTPGILSGLPPAWIIVMWMQFATLMPFCFAWLSRRYAFSSLLGLFGGPLAFVAGERLGGVQFLPPRLLHLAILGGLWSAALPFLVWLTDRLIGSPRNPSEYRWLAQRQP